MLPNPFEEGFMVDEDVRADRMDICKSCDKFIKPQSNTKKCMCFMPIKTKLKTMSCPLGKW